LFADGLCAADWPLLFRYDIWIRPLCVSIGFHCSIHMNVLFIMECDVSAFVSVWHLILGSSCRVAESWFVSCTYIPYTPVPYYVQKVADIAVTFLYSHSFHPIWIWRTYLFPRTAGSHLCIVPTHATHQPIRVPLHTTTPYMDNVKRSRSKNASTHSYKSVRPSAERTSQYARNLQQQHINPYMHNVKRSRSKNASGHLGLRTNMSPTAADSSTPDRQSTVDLRKQRYNNCSSAPSPSYIHQTIRWHNLNLRYIIKTYPLPITTRFLYKSIQRHDVTPHIYC
jgi:hypothetical protein